MTRRYLPGATIGLMGSGQLGRMFAVAARRMGYRVNIFSPEKDTPAGQFADREATGAYEDESAVRKFAKGLDLLTFEFENIPRQPSIGARLNARSARPARSSTPRRIGFAKKIFSQALESLSRLIARCTARPS